MTRAALLLALLVAVVAGPATADAFTPVLRTERVYAHCGSAPKANAGSPGTYGWDTSAPTTSYAAGGGCGQADLSPQQGDEVSFSGTFTGNLDRLTVHAWVIDAGLSRTGLFEDVWLRARVVIDGVTIATGDDVRVVPQPSSTGISRLLEVSVTGIGLLDEEDAGEHIVELHLGSMPYDDGDTIAWVLDAAELDTGITFNPAQLAPVRLRAS